MDAQGLNQTQLASRSGIERSTVNRLINGKARPQRAQVGWLATTLGVDVDELTAGAELSADARRAIEQVREAADRVVRAETERDESIARAERLAEELSRERSERERDRVRILELEASEAQLRRQLRRLSATATRSSRTGAARSAPVPVFEDRARAALVGSRSRR
jgi:transcriptional regulator with XRE-family HTH domain